MIVLDASAAVELVLGSSAGRRVADEIAPDDVSLHAPHLLGIEVAQVLRRLVRESRLATDRAGEALDDLRDLDVYHYEHEPLLGRVWELRDNLTAYDACYVALAEVLRAPLLTFDERLATAPRHRAQVVVVRAG